MPTIVSGYVWSQKPNINTTLLLDEKLARSKGLLHFEERRVMHSTSLASIKHKALAGAACAGLVLATAGMTLGFSGAAWAAKANCTITTVPTPANINTGGSVQFSGTVSGKAPVTYSWNFGCTALG